MAHVSWQCEQSNPDIQVSGYKVLIDGKQYGNAMHEGVKTVRIKVTPCLSLSACLSLSHIHTHTDKYFTRIPM